MPALPPFVTGEHLDQDTDSVFQAREEINTSAWTINQIIIYLSDLFGWSGTKETAIATLFSNQAALFPSGTKIWFFQAVPPPGWYQQLVDGGRYLMAVPDNSGGNTVGNSYVNIQTTATQLIREHLPNVIFSGSTDWQGVHTHFYSHTNVNYDSGSVSFERDANGPKAFARYDVIATGGDGNHYHNVTVASGGAGWGHDHYVNMSGYEPSGLRGVIGIKY